MTIPLATLQGERKDAHTMHTFIVEQLDRTTIMYCRKCGQTFQLMIADYRAYWQHVAFTDAHGDEFELSPMPTCTEVAQKLVFEEFGKPE